MSTIKYGVWFHGNKDEPEGLCWNHREMFITDCKEDAVTFKKEMLAWNGNPDDKYSVCMIVINEIKD